MTDIHIKLNGDASLAIACICACIVLAVTLPNCDFKQNLHCEDICKPNAVKLVDTVKGTCVCDP